MWWLRSVRHGALDEGSRLRTRPILLSLNVESPRRRPDQVALEGPVAVILSLSKDQI
jgi:hypothetical protein